MMRILDNHIAAAVLYRVVLVLGVLLGLFAFVTMVGELEHLGSGGYNFARVLLYVLLRLPGFLYELFPMALLLGAILALAGFAASAELVAMRAGGVSLLRIGGAMLQAGVPLIVAAMLAGEYLAPLTRTMAEQGRAEALYQDFSHDREARLWVRDGNRFVHIGEVLPDFLLREIRIYTVGDHGELQSVVHAEHAVYDNGWQLYGVHERRIDTPPPANAAVPSLDIAPELLSVFLIKPARLSAWNLSRYITHLRENKQRTAIYELALWKKLLLPLVSLVMVLIAIPSVFVNLRSAPVERSVFIGIIAALGFYILDRGGSYLVLLYDLSPLFGALVTPLVFLTAALLVLRRQSLA